MIMWVNDVVSSLGKVIPMRVESFTRGWCCLKHEIEFGPEEFDLVTIPVQLSQHQRPEQTLRAVYNVFTQAAKQSGQHKIIHFKANPTEIVVALQKIPKEDATGKLNVDLEFFF